MHGDFDGYFDDFDLFETCEEYYDDLETWEIEQAWRDGELEIDEEDYDE